MKQQFFLLRQIKMGEQEILSFQVLEGWLHDIEYREFQPKRQKYLSLHKWSI